LLLRAAAEEGEEDPQSRAVEEAVVVVEGSA